MGVAPSAAPGATPGIQAHPAAPCDARRVPNLATSTAAAVRALHGWFYTCVSHLKTVGCLFGTMVAWHDGLLGSSSSSPSGARQKRPSKTPNTFRSAAHRASTKQQKLKMHVAPNVDKKKYNFPSTPTPTPTLTHPSEARTPTVTPLCSGVILFSLSARPPSHAPYHSLPLADSPLPLCAPPLPPVHHHP